MFTELILRLKKNHILLIFVEHLNTIIRRSGLLGQDLIINMTLRAGRVNM